MPEKQKRIPDGYSLSIPFLGIGGTYYSNPGSPTAPPITLTGGLGMGGGGFHAVFLRRGMTSADTLGYGASVDISTGIPSVVINSTIPDEQGIPQPPAGPPVRYLDKRYLTPLGEPMTGWASSVSADNPQYVAPAPSPPSSPADAQSGPGGLYGLLFGPGSD